MEEYIVSARKYRPTTFDSVVGQTALTTTLKHAVMSGKLAHAYLFCGPRGVGKTTCARIFAKTINCLHPTAEGEACNTCESCKAFNEQRSYNILELDAASNNSVENIKSLMEQTRIAPQVGRYKVFIIDEVHMLSTAAFNAFLKTLEEPPAHVIFILATTEKHKIMPTILSRCQLYDFERMSVASIIGHLKKVAEQEGIKVEEQALHVIAEKADGGMRDALSIFDQVASFSQGDITYQKVLEDLNILDIDYYFQMVDKAFANEVKELLLLFNAILSRGFDAAKTMNGMASHIRNVLMAKDPATLPLIEASEEQRARYQEQAARCTTPFLYKALRILNQCDVNYRASSNKRLAVEIALIQVAQITQPDDEAGAGRSPKRLKSLFQKKVAVRKEAAPQVAAVEHASLPEEKAKQEKVQATATPSKPIHRINFNQIGDTFDSLLHGQRETHDTAGIAENDGLSAEQPTEQTVHVFTEDGLRTEWLAMCQRMQTNKQYMALSMRMQNLLPTITDYPHVSLVIDNELLYSQLLPIKKRIETTLRQKLLNTELDLTMRVASPEEIKRIPTRREILQQLQQNNEAFARLCQTLQLQLE